MNMNRKLTVTARVSPRVRQLAMAAARLRGITLSHFAALAIEQGARRELVEDPEIEEQVPTKRATRPEDGTKDMGTQ